MIKTVIFTLLFLSAVYFFAKNIIRLISYLRIGQKEERSGNIKKRLTNVLSIAFGQKKLLREPIAGSMHFLIFWGLSSCSAQSWKDSFKDLLPIYRWHSSVHSTPLLFSYKTSSDLW